MDYSRIVDELARKLADWFQGNPATKLVEGHHIYYSRNPAVYLEGKFYDRPLIGKSEEIIEVAPMTALGRPSGISEHIAELFVGSKNQILFTWVDEPGYPVSTWTLHLP